MIGNTRFRVSGDEATGTGVLVFIGVPNIDQPGEHAITGGHYDWRFRKTDDGWKISYAYLRFVWSKGDRGGMFTMPT